ncbi:helix-turn-helix transcriptional regulator [Streptomyces himalayensis]|uniref:Helix-turn-helix domain-containing protein n=1 Tax=Streptomyces himalayensis subsp. himalayensis TaxID=2756131 RepID=A0A7W0DNU5_9ACTN|nr:helix-turn-helix domain-containing protein [Streptomyces himalayensis]MBA2948506.1 helix-turn-helix domain-containing protein [Streptomyces himalayensis subsp. himalayensis]
MPRTSHPAAASGRAERAPLATPEEVAAYLGVPVKTLYQWRHRRIGPNALKVGRHLRYRWPEVDEWLAAQSAHEYGLTA